MDKLHKILEGKTTGKNPRATGKRVGDFLRSKKDRDITSKDLIRSRNIGRKIKKRHGLEGLSDYRQGKLNINPNKDPKLLARKLIRNLGMSTHNDR